MAAYRAVVDEMAKSFIGYEVKYTPEQKIWPRTLFPA